MVKGATWSRYDTLDFLKITHIHPIHNWSGRKDNNEKFGARSRYKSKSKSKKILFIVGTL